jgi:hypothetical protein
MKVSSVFTIWARCRSVFAHYLMLSHLTFSSVYVTNIFRNFSGRAISEIV